MSLVIDRRLVRLLLFATMGLLLAMLFLGEFYFSKQILALAMLGIAIWGVRTASCKSSPFALLPRLMIVVYALPFSITLGYLFDDNYKWVYNSAQALAASDDILIRQMITVGLVGLLGLIVGIQLANLVRHSILVEKSDTEKILPAKTLDPVIFIALLTIPMVLGWFGAAPETILEVGYASGQSTSAAADANFAAASHVGYAFLVVLLLDLQRERDIICRRTKLLAWAVAFTMSTVVFQLLRGSRECAALIVAVVFLYLTVLPPRRVEMAEQVKLLRDRARKIAMPLGVAVIFFVSLGAFRSNLAETGVNALKVSPLQTIQLGFHEATWTAVLWTNLAMAYEYRTGAVEYHYGNTYTDYFLSLMPGFIAKTIGYERPMESWKGPAWEVGRSIPTCGGLHAVIVPFWNFGIMGAFFILALYGYWLGWAETMAGSRKLWPRLIWAGFLLSSMKWFWYTDMIFIRSLMAVGVAGFAYQIALGFRHAGVPEKLTSNTHLNVDNVS